MSSVARRCPGMVLQCTRALLLKWWTSPTFLKKLRSSVQLGCHMAKISLLQQLLGMGWGSVRKLPKQLHTISPAFLATASLPLPTSSSQCLRELPVFLLIQCLQEKYLLDTYSARHRKSCTSYADFIDKETEAQKGD